MKTVVEPKESIAKLWGIQKIDSDAVYRLMKYVMRVDRDDRVYLHNMVTGQLVALEREEAAQLSSLPARYEPRMELLIPGHFLVPEATDEYRQVCGLRTVLIRLREARKDPFITTYTILPTTACNARCYYCFEKGIKIETMTEQTADDTARFIKEHHGGKKVFLHWFGGEPTVAANIIDRICGSLRDAGIDYASSMTTNGYLLQEDMLARAIDLWKLDEVMISLDGTERNYNEIKAFTDHSGNPYQTVMNNIGRMLDHGIKADLRMNVDPDNSADFKPLLSELLTRFGKHPLLRFSAHAVVDCPGVLASARTRGDDDWFTKTLADFNELASNAGLKRIGAGVPWLRTDVCQAASDSTVTITPTGQLVKCPEQIGACDVIGDLSNGITDPERVCAWKKLRNMEQCGDCVVFPYCFRLELCGAKDRCQSRTDTENTVLHAISVSILDHDSGGR